jgi:hypothetical protein
MQENWQEYIGKGRNSSSVCVRGTKISNHMRAGIAIVTPPMMAECITWPALPESGWKPAPCPAPNAQPQDLLLTSLQPWGWHSADSVVAAYRSIRFRPHGGGPVHCQSLS